MRIIQANWKLWYCNRRPFSVMMIPAQTSRDSIAQFNTNGGESNGLKAIIIISQTGRNVKMKHLLTQKYYWRL